MPWHHIDPDSPGIPEIELWEDYTITAVCKKHGEIIGAEAVINAEDAPRCPECGKKVKVKGIDYDHKWFYWFCVPGCLPDSDCFGPYQSKEVALGAARGFKDV